MKLISLNVEKGKHFEKHKDYIIKENPDILCLQEVLKEDIEKYKKITKSEFAIFEPIINTKIKKENKEVKYIEGIAIFSKLPVIFAGFHAIFDNNKIVQKSDSSLEDFFWKALVVKVLENKKEFTIVNIHGIVTERGEVVTEKQRRYFENLLKILENYKNIILTGDSNAPRGIEIFDKIAKIYKDNIPQEYKTSIDNDIHRVGHLNLRYVIDILFTDGNVKAENIFYKSGMSDHFALVADIK